MPVGVGRGLASGGQSFSRFFDARYLVQYCTESCRFSFRFLHTRIMSEHEPCAKTSEHFIGPSLSQSSMHISALERHVNALSRLTLMLLSVSQRHFEGCAAKPFKLEWSSPTYMVVSYSTTTFASTNIRHDEYVCSLLLCLLTPLAQRSILACPPPPLLHPRSRIPTTC